MPIQKNAAGAGTTKYITEIGEYIVEITKVDLGKSKKGDPMVTIHFATDDEHKRLIRAFFVKTFPFMMAHLAQLKIACGIDPNHGSDELIGKKCGILVEKGKIKDDGKSYPQIVGYGPVSEVDKSRTPQGYQAIEDDPTDSIPF